MLYSDLGADQTLCIGEVFTIFAGNNFTNYQWSTGSTNLMRIMDI